MHIPPPPISSNKKVLFFMGDIYLLVFFMIMAYGSFKIHIFSRQKFQSHFWFETKLA